MVFLRKGSACLGLCRMQHSLSLWTNGHHCGHEKRHTKLRSFHEKGEEWILQSFSSLKCAFPHGSVCVWLVFSCLYLIQSLLLNLDLRRRQNFKENWGIRCTVESYFVPQFYSNCGISRYYWCLNFSYHWVFFIFHFSAYLTEFSCIFWEFRLTT